MDMKVNATLQAMSNITTMQEVSANNIANVLTQGFKASRTTQEGDKVTISQATRDAILKNEAATASTTRVEDALIQTSMNEVALAANITAIKTQTEIYQALNALKK